MNIYKFELKRNLRKTIIVTIICLILLFVSMFSDLNPAQNIEELDELPGFLRGLFVGLGFDTQTRAGSFMFINGFVMLIIVFYGMDFGNRHGLENSSKYDFLYLRVCKTDLIRQRILAYITLSSAVILTYITTASFIFLINGSSITILLLSGFNMLLTSIFFILLVNVISLSLSNKKMLNIITPSMIALFFLMFFIGGSFGVNFLSIFSPFYYSTNHNLLNNQISFMFFIVIIPLSVGMYLIIEKKYIDVDVIG